VKAKRPQNVMHLEKGWWKEEREPSKKPLQIRARRRKLDERYYSVKELTVRFGVSGDVFYDAISSGELFAEQLGGIYRIGEADLLDYLDRKRKRVG
jgi:excisionase family DNA binding protein